MLNTTYMLWRWTKEIGTVIIVRNLDIWLEIVGVEEQRTELERKADWNIDKEE